MLFFSKDLRPAKKQFLAIPTYFLYDRTINAASKALEDQFLVLHSKISRKE
ncbi:hypothetical protein SCRDD08_00702 [Streptococcus cristatus]|uniref:Uncharacterized protein n=1 Tax=Streptococcus cristatus TaxID=45634 RepID=A0A139N3R8_STRCR|nr:hypothetical protein SCRDD08_00702 [Streptococcus cristatus]